MPKKILVLARNDTYGDGMLAYRVTKALVDSGKYEAAMVVKYKTRWESFIYEPEIKPASLPERIAKKISNRLSPPAKRRVPVDKNYDFVLDVEIKPQPIADEILESVSFVPDLVITGLITDFVNTTTLLEIKQKTGAQIYQLLVDMEPLTGGCHHAWDCDGYQRLCERCPAILSEAHKNRAHENLLVKIKNVREGEIKVIALSGRTLEQAENSTLFKGQETIPNINSVIDTEIFNARHRHYAKRIFDIPEAARVIFTGAEYADNERKGIKYFIESLNHLWDTADDAARERILVLIAGKDRRKLENSEQIKSIPFRKKFIDFIGDERLLSLAYQAADVFVCPSVEDPGPVMVSQALACGAPVVGFEMGVVSNMVARGLNGYKAELRSAGDLARGIFEVLSLSQGDYEKYSSTRTLLQVVDQILK